ncbi:MAG: pitrilysin family protein [Acidobacteriota bacterium]
MTESATRQFPVTSDRRPRITAPLARTLVALLTVLMGSLAFAQTAEGTSEFVTSNGLKVIHQRVQGNEVIAVRLYFKGGARNITAENAGIETLMWEVAQNGTKTISKSQINRELAAMGTVIESIGSYDYSLVAMRCVRQHFDRSWQILTEVVLNPTFDDKELELVREQLLSALRQENDDPETVVTSVSSRMLFAAHPYINRPTGSLESVARLTSADLKGYHAAHLSTSRMLAVVVGNVTLEDIKRKTESSFGKLTRGEYTAEPPPSFGRAAIPEFQLSERKLLTTYIRGTFAAPPLSSPDYAAIAIAANILQQLFFQEVRVKRNLSYGADATILAQGANSGFISVTTAKPNETVKVMFDQIDFLSRQLLPAEALRTIVSGYLTNFYLKLETNDAQAARLAEYELLGGGWQRSLTWIDQVRRVTGEDIQRVSRTYLKNFHFAVAGEPGQFDRALFTSR